MNEALQSAIAAINTAAPTQPLIAAKARGLMAGYDARWRDAGYVTLGVEELVQSEFWNPATGVKSRSFSIAGKIDVRATRDRKQILFDHKTCSKDITDPNSPYWRQLVIEGQASHYMLLEWLNGRKVDMAIWDVIRKPEVRPKELSKKEIERVAITRRYCDQEMSDESRAELATTGRETFEMYEARLAYDCTVERPQWYFQRRPVPRLDSEIHEYASELWTHGQEILHTRRENSHVRNSGACMNYGTPCRFLGVCSGYDTIESDNWQPKKSVHAELPMLDGDGRNVLTNSRIRCFQTCKRKHLYDYEVGIERQDEEERETLFFGNVMHSALAAWFLHFTEGAYDTNTNGDQGSESCTATANDAPVSV